MSAVGRVQAAWAAASNETTLALANLNFDFSLVKVEAPTEFRDLGAALSIKRRSAAEHGTIHSTARKLGSLFEQILPSTPRLFKAYGLRASEIAQSPLVNSQGHEAYGPFVEHIGVDGTSVWAAATSGRSAIAVHLLACMLARIWSASEAVAIWEQILVARKKELLELANTETVPLQSLAAAQLSLPRQQLADLDASARAWLRTADVVKKAKQKQLSLIVENLDMPINRKMDVYSSVLHAWENAMITMDNLIGGSGYSVQDGSVLLGLSSWHLYPDIIVLGKTTAEVKQGDALITPGGIVTIGLQGHQGADASHDRGVYWSLSLAHVRFYGDPIKVEGSLTLDSSRVTIDQLLLVALGSLIATWSPNGAELQSSLELFEIIRQYYLPVFSRFLPFKENQEDYLERSWLHLLADTSNRYLRSSGQEQGTMRRLINLGLRRPHFFSHFSSGTSILGLNVNSLLSIMKNDRTKIAFLRKLAVSCTTERDSLIIRIRRVSRDDPHHITPEYEYITALPEEIRYSRTPKVKYRFLRWIEQGKLENEIQAREQCRANYADNAERTLEYPKKSIRNMENPSSFQWNDPPTFFRDVPVADLDGQDQDQDQSQNSNQNQGSKWGPSRWKLHLRSSLPEQNTTPKTTKTSLKFELLCGDPANVALFRRSDRLDIKGDNLRITVTDLKDAFLSKSVSATLFLTQLSIFASLEIPSLSQSSSSLAPQRNSLKALATVAKLYKSLPNATVPLAIVSFGALFKAKWVESAYRDFCSNSHYHPAGLLPFNLTRSQTFSCIAMFESGGFDFSPADLDRVMAISVCDSIYVAAPLLCDPSVRSGPYKVRRIVGNIGRAGLALLIPPTSPKIKRLGVDSYELINHDPFDGKMEDCFQSTTLHLAFSGYELPVDVGEHGSRNIEAFFLESVVSVHDRGEWIADLDILSALVYPQLECTINQRSCFSEHPHQVPNFPLVSIDCWQELLERPLDAGIVRARDNWLARLAATCVSVQLGYETIVFDDRVCWICREKVAEIFQDEAEENMRGSTDASPKITFIL